MDLTHPLSTPEILDIVASFVPAWGFQPRKYHFKPKDLLACARVCKAWRRVILPHLWAVYHVPTMNTIPKEILIKYSHHFRFIDEAHPPWMPTLMHLITPPDWNISLKSTMLKALSISSIRQYGQVNLLHANPNIKLLDWTHLGADGSPHHIVDALTDIGNSVRELHLRNSSAKGRRVALIISHFPNLERLSFLFRPRPSKRRPIRPRNLVYEWDSHNEPTLAPLIPTNKVPDVSKFKEKQITSKDTKASIPSVKHLTISVAMMQSGWTDVFHEILTRCPEILQIQVEAYTNKLEAVHRHTAGIQKAILKWRHQYLKWKRLQAKEAEEAGIEPDESRNTEQGLEDLTIKVYADQCRDPPRPYYQKFENGCSDLVAISTVVSARDIPAIFDLIRSFKHTLRRVELDFLCYETSFSQIFREIMTTFTGLETMMIVTQKRFTRHMSGSIFQQRSRPVELACMGLKALYLDCLYRGEEMVDYREVLNTGEHQWTWPAFTEGHRWRVTGRYKSIRPYFNTIVLPLQQLPELRSLTINGAPIVYEEILADVPTEEPEYEVIEDEKSDDESEDESDDDVKSDDESDDDVKYGSKHNKGKGMRRKHETDDEESDGEVVFNYPRYKYRELEYSKCGWGNDFEIDEPENEWLSMEDFKGEWRIVEDPQDEGSKSEASDEVLNIERSFYEALRRVEDEAPVTEDLEENPEDEAKDEEA